MVKPFASSADLTDKAESLEVLDTGVYALTAEGDPNVGAPIEQHRPGADAGLLRRRDEGVELLLAIGPRRGNHSSTRVQPSGISRCCGWKRPL